MSRKSASVVAFWVLAATVCHAHGVNWVVDPARSKLTFSGTQGGAPFDGDFRKFAADISFDPDHLDQSAVKVTIALGSAVTGDNQRDDMIGNSDWFDVKHFPAATFEATKFTRQSNGIYDAEGVLTIRNITRKVSLPFSLGIMGNTAHAKGRLTISRKDYGVGSGAWASDQIVGYRVNVNFDLWAKHQ